MLRAESAAAAANATDQEAPCELVLHLSPRQKSNAEVMLRVALLVRAKASLTAASTADQKTILRRILDFP